MGEMKITIIMGQDGSFSVNTSDGTPMIIAIGALEVAKNVLLNGDVQPITEDTPQSEIIEG